MYKMTRKIDKKCSIAQRPLAHTGKAERGFQNMKHRVYNSNMAPID